MRIKDMVRNMMGIRQVRQTPPPGPQPVIGSNIVRGRLRIHLKFPIDGEQWDWLTLNGWRTIDLRDTRRRYSKVADSAASAMLNTPVGDKRDQIHQAILDAAAEKAAQRKTARKESLK